MEKNQLQIRMAARKFLIFLYSSFCTKIVANRLLLLQAQSAHRRNMKEKENAHMRKRMYTILSNI